MGRSRRIDSPPPSKRRASPHAVAAYKPSSEVAPAKLKKKAKPKAARSRKKSLKETGAGPAVEKDWVAAVELLPAISATNVELGGLNVGVEPKQADAAENREAAKGEAAKGEEGPEFVLGDRTEFKHAPARIAVEAVAVFDPFDASERDPPWTPPEDDEICALDHDDGDINDVIERPIAEYAAPPPPMRNSPPVASISSPPQDYLARARRAAQENYIPPRAARKILGLELSLRSAVALAAASSFAVAILVAGLMSNDVAGADGPRGVVGPASASANEDRSSIDFEALYAAAAREIAAGEYDAGIPRLRRAAEGGVPMAQYRLAKLHENGEGVERNLVLARQWTERAAHGGNCRAMHDAGVYHARGEGAPANEAEAYRWFHEAAMFGVADSQYNLGVFYQQGRGVSLNPHEALFWFLVAARNRDANAADRAVELATQLQPSEVNQARVRARAFRARSPNALANGASEPWRGCANT